MSKVYFAADHAGYALKQALMEHVRAQGHEAEDLGAFTLEREDDYPDYVMPCAVEVAHDPESYGIIIGGSGQGEAMCANRVKGVRAAVFYGPMRVTESLDIEGGHSEDGFDLVRLARRHNNANILSIGARFMSGKEAAEAVHLFLETPFSQAPRHTRRLAKF
jgi:ribose 5-phosphate isomerase B